MTSRGILITGGVRSGKSAFAQSLAKKLGAPVLFVATAEAGDEEMARRIAEHRKVRPAAWRTLEATSRIGPLIEGNAGGAGVVLLDCVTLLVSNILGQHSPPGAERLDASAAASAVTGEIGGLVDCMGRVRATFIIVTNEVGMGVVPATEMGRVYGDLLGRANQALAERCDEVYLMVAGLAVRLKPAGGQARERPA